MRLLYFAELVDLLQVSQEDVALPAGVRDVGGLLDWLAGRGPPWAALAVPGAVQVTVNKQFAARATDVTDHDEVALFPRRTG